VYKNDGNAIGVPTYIWLHELTADGTATVGQPTPLIRNTLVCALTYSPREPSPQFTLVHVLHPAVCGEAGLSRASRRARG
jgi:hypothetical protein